MADSPKVLTPEELQAALTTSEARVAELENQLEEATALITEQQQALSEKETQTEAVVVTVEKKKYRVTAPRFIVNGKVVEAADLKKDAALAKALVARKSGILSPL